MILKAIDEHKIIRTLHSCETDEQLMNAKKMIELFEMKWDEKINHRNMYSNISIKEIYEMNNV